MALNCIAIKNLRLSEVRDSPWTSIHFELISNLLICQMSKNTGSTKTADVLQNFLKSSVQIEILLIW